MNQKRLLQELSPSQPKETSFTRPCTKPGVACVAKKTGVTCVAGGFHSCRVKRFGGGETINRGERNEEKAVSSRSFPAHLQFKPCANKTTSYAGYNRRDVQLQRVTNVIIMHHASTEDAC